MDAHTADHSDEAELVQRARHGEQEAWEILTQRHRQSMYRLAYLLSGDAQDADDTTQDALLRAYLSLDRFDLDRPLRPWLLSIAANLASNRRRSWGRYLAALRRLWASETMHTPAHSAPVERLAEHKAQANHLWSAVRRLDYADQQVIYLRYFLELPVEETAQVLQVAAGTVKSRSARALQRLRQVIHQDFPDLWETYAIQSDAYV